MRILTASNARSNLYQLLEQVADTHDPVLIRGKRANGVLLSAEDWDAIQATLHLLSIAHMHEAIKEGMAEAVDECSKELRW